MKRIIRDLAVFAGFYALFAFIFVLILSLFIQGYKYFTGNEGRIEGFFIHSPYRSNICSVLCY